MQQTMLLFSRSAILYLPTNKVSYIKEMDKSIRLEEFLLNIN